MICNNKFQLTSDIDGKAGKCYDKKMRQNTVYTLASAIVHKIRTEESVLGHKKGILAVSFGSTCDRAREEEIEGIEKD